MAWGNILSQVVGAINPGLGAGVSFLSNIMDSSSQKKKAKQAENEYYAALAQQKQLAQISAQTAQQRAAFEAAMKQRILTQTGELGSTLRAAQQNMGAMPQFNQDTINQDYAATKAGMMQDFTSMLELVESQGRAGQISRLGGAGSTAADNDRMNALVKRFTPELQKIDDAAYDSAVGRATNSMNLINTSRQNTLGELAGVINPQLNAEMQLLSGSPTDITALINGQGGYLNQTSANSSNQSRASGTLDANTQASLGALLSQVFNRPQDDGFGKDIVWEKR